MPADRPNTITLHLNSNDPQWLPWVTAGWDTRWDDGCEDNTRDDDIPDVGEIGELPWSPRFSFPNTEPLSDMTGVYFEPLGGLTTPNFLVPFYDWGVRAAWFGRSSGLTGRLSSGDYLELLFDTAEARETFKNVFGTDIKLTRTGRNVSSDLINEDREYTGSIDTSVQYVTENWGTQNLFMLSWAEVTPNVQTIISNVVNARLNNDISTIIDIEFTSAAGAAVGIDIMGTCDPQHINPCDPVVPPECESDVDCISCNSTCVGGTCICDDCPCYSVCINVDADFPHQGISGVRELIDGNQENCVDCTHPSFPDDDFCNCFAAIAGGKCRPERDQLDGTNCDCPPGQVCCFNVLAGEWICCDQQEFNNGNFVQRCIPGFGCAQTQCAVDADCDGDCMQCQLDADGRGLCVNRADNSPCGNAGSDCTHCMGGDCECNPLAPNCCRDCGCPAGFECCPEGHCCETALGGCNGPGCNQCDDDGDCVAQTGDPCSYCANGVCVIIDCPPCERPNADCVCVEGLVCPDECRICVADGAGNESCVENCPDCSDCDEHGECGDPPECEPDETLDEDCNCVGGCLDCEVWNGLQCVIWGCGCCKQCVGFGGEGGSCQTDDSSLCPGNQACVDCLCITVGCPDCAAIGDGCLVCDETTFTCVPPADIGQPESICLPDCEICQQDGTCGDSSCDGECCADDLGSCCEGKQCCPWINNAFYCCELGDVCCNDGTCCPSGQSCCGDNCCDPALCETCVGGECVVCAGQDCATCVNGNCESGCDPDCETCVDGNCVLNEAFMCDPDCCDEIDGQPSTNCWCDLNNCIPDPACDEASECECVIGGSNDPCQCWNSEGLGALMDCDCGGGGGGGAGRGACCSPLGACTQQTAADCSDMGGSYKGDDTECLPNPCSGIG